MSKLQKNFSFTGASYRPSERVPVLVPPGSFDPNLHPKVPEREMNLVQNDSWPGLKLQDDKMGGQGVFALKNFSCGAFICHYGGILLDNKAYKEDSDSRVDKFMFEITLKTTHWYFNHYENTKFSHGKMINHSKTCANVVGKVLEGSDGQPVVLFKVIKSIKPGEQLLYDYGKNYAGLMPCVPNCKKCRSKLTIHKPIRSISVCSCMFFVLKDLFLQRNCFPTFVNFFLFPRLVAGFGRVWPGIGRVSAGFNRT